MTLRLRFGIAGAVVVVLLVALGLIIPRVVTTSQITQVDQQLTEALPRALVLVKGSGTFGLPPAGKNASRAAQWHRAIQQHLHRRHYLKRATGPRGALIWWCSSGGAECCELGADLTTGDRDGRFGERSRCVACSPRAALEWSGGSHRRFAGIGRRDGCPVASGSAGRGRRSRNHPRRTVVVLIRLGLDPIVEVTSVADPITGGDRSRRVHEARPGSEAGHLARAFNVMLDEEQATEDHLRRFVADASHELRTPVTVIQGVAELWQRGALSEEGAIDDALRRVGQEGARMAALVEDLLLLARLDEGRPLGDEPVDLSQLTPDVHTRPGTRVRLRVTRDGEQSVVEVEDNGPGMEPDDGPRAFERFWRGDPARSGPGSGLGLSIVSGIVAAHHGSVEMTTAPGRGTTVRVTIPAPFGQTSPSEAVISSHRAR